MNSASAIHHGDFKHADIGAPLLKGHTLPVDAGLDVTAGGSDIWDQRDEFHYAYTERTGDFDIWTRIDSLDAPHLYTKAGIMAREDLSESCRHIYFQVFHDNSPRNSNNGGYEYQYRAQRDGEMKAIYPATHTGPAPFPVNYPAVWIRLSRKGDAFTGLVSTDGKHWLEYATYHLALPAQLLLGFAVTSHDANALALAKFRDSAESAAGG